VTSLLTVLPLAFVMVAGPQIVSAVFFATSVDWKRTTAAYLAGALVSVTFFVTVGYVVASLVGGEPKGSDEGSGASAIDIAIVLLLGFLVVYVFLNRKKAEPPKWMGKLQSATPKFAFTLGLLLMGVFPTDIITSTTVGGYLARQDDPWWYCLPFLVVTMLFLALPALLVLVLGQRGQVFLPKARDWMNTNSWIVNEIVIVFFLVVSINSLVS
jgi:hypothetical protein